MMRHVRLTGAAARAEASQTLQRALQQLQQRPCDAQSVLSSLMAVLHVLDAHPQASALVDATLASETHVLQLQAAMRLHVAREELQCALCRVVALSCAASRRFQCQAGRLQLWRELALVRAELPQSLRALEASLLATDALFRGHELHVGALRAAAPPLLHELLALMDRFRLVRTPRRRSQALVRLALRVLSALLASPRGAELLLAAQQPHAAAEWVRAILRRLLASLSLFLADEASTRLWLAVALFLTRQQPQQAAQSLFPASPAAPDEREDAEGRGEWFLAVLARWQARPLVAHALLSVFTHVFALPHATTGDYEQLELAQRLLARDELLAAVADVVAHYSRLQQAGRDTEEEHEDAKQRGTFRPAADWPESGQDAEAPALLEALRLVRQWSARPALLSRLQAARCVRAALLPALVQQLERRERASFRASHNLQLVLESVLVLRLWAAHAGLRSELRRCETLQTALRGLRAGSRPSRGRTAASRGGASRPEASLERPDDAELHALVARETRELLALLAVD